MITIGDNMKKTIIGIIVGVVVGTISTVVASSYIASQIAYTPKDSTWKVDNVEAAIDSLKLSKTSDNFSTEERVVGTWIDGKPLYQKTLYFDNNGHGYSSSNTTKILVSDILTVYNIDKVIDINGMLNNGKYFYPAATDGVKMVAIDNGNLIAYIYNSSFSWNILITLQYTKTTDQATN